MWTAACNNKVVMRALLIERVNVMAADRDGTTALMHAETMGHSLCAEMLLAARCSVLEDNEKNVC
jgi:ankyrin repeat protein